MRIRTITAAFHAAFPNLRESLNDKGRGYGVMTITVQSLTFAIPLRTNLSHPHGKVLDVVQRRGVAYKRGLDYTKAVLITDPATQLGTTFTIPTNQLAVLRRLNFVIEKEFNRYVNRYVDAVKRGQQNTLSGSAYRYTTLVNYHAELQIK